MNFLKVTFAIGILSLSGCSQNSEYEKIPPLNEWVQNMRTSEEWLRKGDADAITRLVMGKVDNLLISAQTLYESQPVLERELQDSLTSHLQDLIPQLRLVEDTN